MKIIKEGDLRKLLRTKRFTCKACGCVFEMDKGEYKVDMQYNEEYCWCVCPTCKQTVLDYVDV